VDQFTLDFKDRQLSLNKRVAVMGILNVTPDSFFDGGRYLRQDAALRRVEKMVQEGVDVIDIGGESTRPGSQSVSLRQELKRVIPLIRRAEELFKVPLCVDTYKAQVAREAIEAGARMINDISGLRFDKEMARVAASYNVPVVIMHIRGTPRIMQRNPRYENLIEEIISYLRKGIDIALAAGVSLGNIIVDPGIGFGKTVRHNLQIIKNLAELKTLGRPILIGISRKSFIGKVLNLPPEERFEGGLTAVSLAVLAGARIIRTHDVKSTRRVVDMVQAILDS